MKKNTPKPPVLAVVESLRPHGVVKARKTKRVFEAGAKVKGAPGYLHAGLVGVVEWSRGASCRVRWTAGGSLTGPARIFVAA